jgi:hypothetical protein
MKPASQNSNIFQTTNDENALPSDFLSATATSNSLKSNLRGKRQVLGDKTPMKGKLRPPCLN